MNGENLMPKAENQNLKILYIAKYLLENTDENHSVSSTDICDYLINDCGISAERRSVYRDIELLKNVFGMDRFLLLFPHSYTLSILMMIYFLHCTTIKILSLFAHNY